MRVFLTGATGFIGSAIVEELKGAGHEVTGLARSDEAVATLASWGVQTRRGDVGEPGGLAEAARASEGSSTAPSATTSAAMRKWARSTFTPSGAVAGALAGSGKPFVVTSGMTGAVPGRIATEADPAQTEGMAAVRGAPETLALAASKRNVRSVVVRLPPSVHDRQAQGLVSLLIETARRTGVSAYLGDGAARWPAVHRRDAARLFRLGLESGQPGQRLHAVGEEGVTLRAIARAIGDRLGLPVRGLDAGEAAGHFGWLAFVVGNDLPASSASTRESLGWRPDHPGLLEGLSGEYLTA